MLEAAGNLFEMTDLKRHFGAARHQLFGFAVMAIGLRQLTRFLEHVASLKMNVSAVGGVLERLIVEDRCITKTLFIPRRVCARDECTSERGIDEPIFQATFLPKQSLCRTRTARIGSCRAAEL